MPQQEPVMPTACDHCGELFNTSLQHPRRYCSIACEEGRAPLPMDDPKSPDYHLYLQGEPRDLLGKVLVANGLRRTCYSPDWHRDPDSYERTAIVSHDEENEILVIKTDTVIGQVVDYGADGYIVEHEDRETGDIATWVIHDFLMVEQIREGRWWVDG